MRLNEELAQKILGDIEEGRRFFCSDGKIFSNLEDLRKDIGEMSDEIFFRHVEEGRNDFSNWVRECFGDVRLADGLIGLDREGALKKIEARISYIKRYLDGKL